mgnify:CR=1 FL=1
MKREFVVIIFLRHSPAFAPNIAVRVKIEALRGKTQLIDSTSSKKARLGHLAKLLLIERGSLSSLLFGKPCVFLKRNHSREANLQGKRKNSGQTDIIDRD